MKDIRYILAVFCAAALLLSGCDVYIENKNENVSIWEENSQEYITEQETLEIVAVIEEESEPKEEFYFLENIPDFSGASYVIINGGQPDFSESDRQLTEAFEIYSDLDALGRCGAAYANICQEIMPTEARGSIGQIKPSGWHTVKYNDRIDGNYLYNRCHLIAYQLAGENANEKNLITGTRYLNVEGMLPFEEKVADYVMRTGNHVLYRVTPIFDGDNLLASGVEMEAWSVEDNGTGICFHVYCYNVQPGIEINYANGESCVAEDDIFWQTSETAAAESVSENGATEGFSEEELEVRDYVLNRNTKRIHLPDCSSVNDMAEHNKEKYRGTLDDLKADGYIPCGNCLAQWNGNEEN